ADGFPASRARGDRCEASRARSGRDRPRSRDVGDGSPPRRSAGVRHRALTVIRIRKPGAAPRILVERGAVLTEELCARVDAGEVLSSDLFKHEVYGAAEVKEVLRAAQHDKCCLCEAKLGHAQPGDVEHFRPKARARSAISDTSGACFLSRTRIGA